MENQYNIQKSDFKFIKEHKIYDKKFETKPIGYFKDAFIRFRKNKINLIASFILLSIILLSIIVPIVTTKNYEKQETNLAFLPPKVPFLEWFGFLDGTTVYEDAISDRTKIDPESGLYLPSNYDAKYIVPGSLTNDTRFGSVKSAEYFGGTNELRLDNQSTATSIRSNVEVELIAANNPTFNLKLNGLTSGFNENVNIYLFSSANGLQLITSFQSVGTEAGFTFKPFDTIAPDVITMYRIVIELTASQGARVVSLKSLTITDDSQVEPIYDFEGFNLSQFMLYQGSGTYNRLNAEYTVTSFRYRIYEAKLNQPIKAVIDQGVYEGILASNPGMLETAVPDPENPGGLIFAPGYPLSKFIIKSSGIPGPGGQWFYPHTVEYIYGDYLGIDALPDFFFGTDSLGRDLFALTWVGIRTSLIIGVVASLINIIIGVVYGAISGYYGGVVDLLMERFSEVIGRIPWLVTLSIFYSLFGPGILTLVLILILTGWIGIGSITRTQFYRYKGREYVLAARTLGAGDTRLIFRHILPNGIGTIITSSILMIPGVIFTESTLSFLGYGIGEGQVIDLGIVKLSGTSLGVLLSNGQLVIQSHPHLVAFPALMVAILMITFNMFGNALRDAFNPSLRGVEE